MSYFLIKNDEGDTIVTKIDPEKFLKELKDGDWGEDLHVLDFLPSNTDTNYWGKNTVLIIKGEVVRPKPIEVATKYEF